MDEVPAIARIAAPALRADAKIAIGGLSMGGYGALRLGAKFADRFSSISAHSAITDIREMAKFVEEPISDYLVCAPSEELSAIYWLRKHRDRLPRLRFDCGLDDPLIEAIAPCMTRCWRTGLRIATRNSRAGTNGRTGRSTLRRRCALRVKSDA